MYSRSKLNFSTGIILNFQRKLTRQRWDWKTKVKAMNASKYKRVLATRQWSTRPEQNLNDIRLSSEEAFFLDIMKGTRSRKNFTMPSEGVRTDVTNKNPRIQFQCTKNCATKRREQKVYIKRVSWRDTRK